MASSDAISPTAHYTGWVWWRNGLSHPLLATREGRVLYDVLAPAMRAGSLLGGPSLETYLLARHAAIDERLERAIEHEGVTQVVCTSRTCIWGALRGLPCEPFGSCSRRSCAGACTCTSQTPRTPRRACWRPASVTPR